MAVGEFGGWAIHRVPSQVLLGVPDGARVVRVTPPVLGDQAEQLPSEMEATRHRDKVLEAVCSGVLVCQRLLRPHDPVHSELITVGQNELVFQLQLLTDLPQDGRGACQAGLVLGEQLPHAQLGAMGGRGELGDRDLAEGIDMLDENGLDNHPQAGLLALKALLVGQNLGTNKNKVSISTFLSSFPADATHIIACHLREGLNGASFAQRLVHANGLDENPHGSIEESARLSVHHMPIFDIFLIVIVGHHQKLLVWAPGAKAWDPLICPF